MILVSGSSNGSQAADTCVNSRWHTTSRLINAFSVETQLVKSVVDLHPVLWLFLRRVYHGSCHYLPNILFVYDTSISQLISHYHTTHNNNDDDDDNANDNDNDNDNGNGNGNGNCNDNDNDNDNDNII